MNAEPKQNNSLIFINVPRGQRLDGGCRPVGGSGAAAEVCARAVRAAIHWSRAGRPHRAQRRGQGVGALTPAREDIVLLKNEGVLPLRKDLKRIAVIGPNAHDKINWLGDYALDARRRFACCQRPPQRTRRFTAFFLGMTKQYAVYLISLQACSCMG